MSKKLLTRVATRLVNEYATAKEYGVSLVTIPDFDYPEFADQLDAKRCAQIFFLGFSKQQEQALFIWSILTEPRTVKESILI